jgi:hypothetical protein
LCAASRVSSPTHPASSAGRVSSLLLRRSSRERVDRALIPSGRVVNELCARLRSRREVRRRSGGGSEENLGEPHVSISYRETVRVERQR